MKYGLQFVGWEGQEWPRPEVLDEAEVSLRLGSQELLEIAIQDARGNHKRIIVTAVVEKYVRGLWVSA